MQDQSVKPKRSEPDSASDVGLRLRRFRTHAGITQHTLARTARLTPKFLSQIENGHVNPSIGVLARLVETGLGLPLAAFFADPPEEQFPPDLAKVIVLYTSQPPRVRKLALRVLETLCAASSESSDR